MADLSTAWQVQPDFVKLDYPWNINVSNNVTPPLIPHIIHQVRPVVYWGGIRGFTAYTNLRVFLTAYTHLSDHK